MKEGIMALKTRYSLLSKVSLENIYNSFIALSPQGRVVALSVGGFILVLLILLPTSLMSGKIASLQREISSSQDTLRQISDKLTEYQNLKTSIEDMERSFGVGVGSLATSIEGIATKSNVRSNMDSLRGKPAIDTEDLAGEAVELRLSKLTLSQLIDFLYNVEHNTNGFMKVTKIEVRPMYSNRGLLDVSCEIANYTLKKGA